jgi:glycosyltransferase involved in cell wall biosynthesis
MHIVHVIGSIAPRLGGPSKAVLEMSGALAARGHDVDIVTTTLADRGSWSPIRLSERVEVVETGRRLARDGFCVTYCRPVWPTRWATSVEMSHVLRALIPKADVVHIHSLYLFPTLVASRLARLHGVPYLLRPHGSLDPYIRRRHRLLKVLYHAVVEDSALRGAAGIHFTTEEERQLAASALPPAVKSYVIPLGVDVAEFDELPNGSSVRQGLNLDRDAVLGLFLGRLNHKKGLDLLAPAFIQLCARLPNARLIVAGPDDDGLGRQFLAQCERGGVGDRVRLFGFLDRAQIKRMFAAADFWVLPSYSENFGISVVEAMAARLPVVITDRVNIWRSVRGAGAGVVTKAEVNSVSEGMLRVASQGAEARAVMGQRGRALCESEFSWQAVAQQLEGLYATVANQV